MAQVKIIRRLSEFVEAIRKPAFLLGLHGKPTTPWYLGQASANGSLLPAFYAAGTAPSLEREILRDFRILAAEFIPPAFATDQQWLISAHQNGLPTRILEWQGNPLAALFFAVESMAEDRHGKVWIFNPWTFNEGAAGIGHVPMTDTDYFSKYVVELSNPDGLLFPEAENPMAFRPYRNVRPYSTQNVYWTVHGNLKNPLETQSYFLRKTESFLTFLLIDGEQKKAIMKELYEINVTRASLFPGLTNIVRTLGYRYSKDYVTTEI
jgi:FRG domain